MEALKQELVTDSTDLASKLVKSNQFMDDIAGLLAWVDEAAGSLDELVIRDPKSAPIETQHKKCQVYNVMYNHEWAGCVSYISRHVVCQWACCVTVSYI